MPLWVAIKQIRLLVVDGDVIGDMVAVGLFLRSSAGAALCSKGSVKNSSF